MSQRKYSVAEIDRMRQACGVIGPDETTEDRLRTYMLNGTAPSELEDAAEKHVAPMRAFIADLKARGVVGFI